MRNVRLTPLDGKLPNIALMKLAHFHRAQGDNVYLEESIEPSLFEPKPDIVYGSAIFLESAPLVGAFKRAFPTAFVSGTGVDPEKGGVTVERMIGIEADDDEPWQYENYDYSIYPDFKPSIGFTQRGCRLACKFCGVSGKEGKARSVNAIERIWRGPGHPKKLLLLDNDFFGVPEWREQLRTIGAGGFKVCLSQGINIRLINEEQARELAAVEYRDTSFSERQLYTAWDNLGHERIFFRGVDMLERAGIPPKHLMVYMLCGYDVAETWEQRWYRFLRMVERDIKPFVMVWRKWEAKADLICWQRWVNFGIYRFIPWPEYERETKSEESMQGYLAATGARA